MTPSQTQHKVARARQRVAASYRQLGYRVSLPANIDAMPPFLRDCHPSLVAERDDDRVVVEIKPAGTLKGANDLVELAERVAMNPGWRLELVALRQEEPVNPALAPGWLDQKLTMAGETPVCFFRAALLEVLIRSMAALEGLRVKQKSARDLAHELAFQGAMDGDLVSRIDAALQWQTDILQDRPNSRSVQDQAAELDAICSAVSALQRNTED